MSIAAITYVKTLDVSNPMSRLLLFSIAERTFVDSGLCRVSQQVFVYDTRASERTVRNHLKKLETAGVIKRDPQYPDKAGRLPDAIELVGFLDWHRAAGGLPAKSAGRGGAGSTRKQAAGRRGGSTGKARGWSTGKQAAGSYRIPVQETPVQERDAQSRPAPADDIVEAMFEEITQPAAGPRSNRKLASSFR